MGYDAEATRRRIFQAATAEFAARGLAGARIDRIATEARANKQAIYLYFGSKEKLFGAVVRAKMAEIGHATDIDPDSLAESVGRLFDWYREHPELVRLLLWEALETPDRTQGEAERREEFQRKARHFTEHGAGGGTPGPGPVAGRPGPDVHRVRPHRVELRRPAVAADRPGRGGRGGRPGAPPRVRHGGGARARRITRVRLSGLDDVGSCLAGLDAASDLPEPGW
ncbi:TetR/AcrR family transcriptional regulator [Actinomadura madurae]|uniref:TetR/AcrR family transcriptional regulator n=1 Tax=Actinomadura madurae TaxID=1993 RepID=UPI0020D24939|nr:TetR/AcrR family transcriptional regulator [Actinomadura madurae]MCQ0014995.1 TetR/AcrR family transcriptional regulator [Actinomadura madurae]